MAREPNTKASRDAPSRGAYTSLSLLPAALWGPSWGLLNSARIRPFFPRLTWHGLKSAPSQPWGWSGCHGASRPPPALERATPRHPGWVLPGSGCGRGLVATHFSKASRWQSLAALPRRCRHGARWENRGSSSRPLYCRPPLLLRPAWEAGMLGACLSILFVLLPASSLC